MSTALDAVLHDTQPLVGPLQVDLATDDADRAGDGTGFGEHDVGGGGHVVAARRGHVAHRDHHGFFLGHAGDRSPQQVGRHAIAAGAVEPQHDSLDAIVAPDPLEDLPEGFRGNASGAASTVDRAHPNDVSDPGKVRPKWTPARIRHHQRVVQTRIEQLGQLVVALGCRIRCEPHELALHFVGIKASVAEPLTLGRRGRKRSTVDDIAHGIGRHPPAGRNRINQRFEQIVGQATELFAFLRRHARAYEAVSRSLVASDPQDFGSNVEPVEQSLDEESLDAQSHQQDAACLGHPELVRAAGHDQRFRAQYLPICNHVLAALSQVIDGATQ